MKTAHAAVVVACPLVFLAVFAALFFRHDLPRSAPDCALFRSHE
jgi:hypothetical protein